MKTGDFKQNVSEIVAIVANGLKHGMKPVVKTFTTDEPPISDEPDETGDTATAKELDV